MLTAEEAARMDEEDDDGDDGDDDGDGADGPVLPFSGIAEGAAAAPPASPPRDARDGAAVARRPQPPPTATASPPPPTTTTKMTTPPLFPRHHRATIRLTSGKERIFRLLVAAAEAHEAGLLAPEGVGTADEAADDDGGGSGASFYRRKPTSPPGPPPPMATTVGIRVAGGWVRDKLLDQHIADVDVALGSCSATCRRLSILRGRRRRTRRRGTGASRDGCDGIIPK